MRKYPFKAVAYRGIGGVNLTNKSVSNDLPAWMVDHRSKEYPSTIVERAEKEWSPYNQKAKIRSADMLNKINKLTSSGDAPTWMTEQNRRIDPQLVRDPPINFSGLYGEKTFVNRFCSPSYRKTPKPHESEIRSRAKRVHRASKRKVKDIPIKGAVSMRVDRKTDLNGNDTFVPEEFGNLDYV